MDQTITQIEPAELYKKLSSGENLFILDVRNETEFKNWPITSKYPLDTINVPYFLFLEDEEAYLSGLPQDQEIIVVCAKGGASDYIVELLNEKSYHARNLKGGMLAWSELYTSKQVPSEPELAILQVARIAKGCLSYLIASANEALVIDPNRHIEQYEKLAENNGWHIKGVIDTHLHADHVSGGHILAEKLGVPFYLSSHDAGELQHDYHPLTDGSILTIGDIQIEVMPLNTPGHTPGSTSLLVNKQHLFTGDTLFVSGIGRPDLGGQAENWVHGLYKTLYSELRDLHPSTYIYPGHYSDHSEFDDHGIIRTTLFESYRHNPALQLADKSSFIEFVMKNMGQQPDNFPTIRQVNKGTVHVADDQLTELEIGPNRCAVSGG